MVYDGAQTKGGFFMSKKQFESCAVYEGTQTSFANKYTRISFESCAVYDDSETRKGLYARLRGVWFTRAPKH